MVLLMASGFASAPVRSAAETPCDEVHPAELTLTARADLLDLAVGDVVELQVEITNTTGGRAGIPLFRLLGAEPLLAVEAQENSYPYVEFVRYRLRAVREGQAVAWMAVNFETAIGCVDQPIGVFRSASSAPYPIAVRGAAVTASATPTATATPSPPPTEQLRCETPSARPIAHAPRRCDATRARTSAASPRR